MAVLMASVIMQVGHKAAGGWRQVAGTRNRSRPSRNPRWKVRAMTVRAPSPNPLMNTDEMRMKEEVQ